MRYVEKIVLIGDYLSIPPRDIEKMIRSEKIENVDALLWALDEIKNRETCVENGRWGTDFSKELIEKTKEYAITGRNK